MKYPEAGEVTGRALDRLYRSFVLEPSGCWRWTRAKTTAGYGHFHWRGDYYQAHRFVYSLLRGPVTTSAMDHLCRNRWCVNPDHLEPVTHAENTRRGIGTRLTPTKVRAIRSAVAAGASYRKVAALFAVDHSTICRVVTRERWSDIPQLEEAVA